MYYLKVFIVTFSIFIIIDLIWLGLVAKNFYSKYLGYIMAPQPNWPVAIIFYMLFVVGMMVFVLLPALSSSSMSHALLYGMLFGFFTYATYDLTNWATLKDWPWFLSIVDIIWGSSLGALTSSISYYVLKHMFKL